MSDDDEIFSESSSFNSLWSSPSTSQNVKRELCVFYGKVGTCRHGSKCLRAHVPPTRSKTILLKNFYPEFLSSDNGTTLLLKNGDELIYKNEAERENNHLIEFYTEVMLEVSRKYGEVHNLYICQNINDHMRGNVYIQFRSETSAKAAVEALNNRWFAGLPIDAQLSPVTDFHGSAICRQFEIGNCNRGNLCNFLHLRPIPWRLKLRVKRQIRHELRVSKVKDSDEYIYHNRLSSSSSNSSTSASTSSASETNSDNDDFNDNDCANIPKTFSSTCKERKRKCFNQTSSSEMSDHEFEIVQKTRQLIRHRRWQTFRRKLLETYSPPSTPIPSAVAEEEWNEVKEQNFIFSLL